MSPTATPSRSSILAAFAAVYVIWGSTYFAIRVAIETVPPFAMAGARFLIAGAMLYVWARLRGAPGPGRTHWRRTALLGALLLVGGNGGVVWAEQRVPSGLTSLLVAMVPVWTVLIEWLWTGGTRPTGRVAAGLVTGFAGVLLLVAPGRLAGGPHVDPIGALVLLIASLSWSIGSVLARRIPLPASASLTSAMEMLAGGGLLLGLALATGELAHIQPAAVSARSAAAFVYLIVFGSLVGFSAFAWLLRFQPASRVATYAYVNPAVAVLLGWALAGEPLTPRTMLAALVIVSGVVLIANGRATSEGQRRSAAPPSSCAGGVD